VGEEKLSLYSSMRVSTHFYYMEKPFLGAMDAATLFPLFFEKIVRKKKIPSLRDDLTALLQKYERDGSTYSYL